MSDKLFSWRDDLAWICLLFYAVCCHGISASQCYALGALVGRGDLTMGELACYLSLNVSSVTRLVDSLVRSGFAKRAQDPGDRRVWRVRSSKKGAALYARIRSEIVAEYVEVLRGVPATSRSDVIEAIARLHGAFEKRQVGGTFTKSTQERS